MRKLEKAFLIGVQLNHQKKWECTESFDELKALSTTAGVEIGCETVVVLKQFTSATYLGSGKVLEIKKTIQDLKLDLAIIDAELSPAQNQNLEKEWCVRVIDRTGLILDIFAQSAKSMEGQLQVELAQYQYLYPRLTGAWTHLSKQRGGAVGLRGPGETQLEVDRRRARERMARVAKELKRVESTRLIHRNKRQKVPIPTVSLVGYTNAGKSTLFNALLQSDQLAADRLFATLDPKTKKLKLPKGRDILLSDTVGFIRNLPHQLVESFKSTFEEVGGSNLLLHVVDFSHPSFRHQMETVEKVLLELKLDHIPVINVMNKIDKAQDVSLDFPNAIGISAATGKGLDQLLDLVEEKLASLNKSVKLFLPHPYGSLLSQLYSNGTVHEVKEGVKGVKVEVSLSEKWYKKFQQYIVK